MSCLQCSSACKLTIFLYKFQVSESREARDRSLDEDTIHYSMSEGEGGPAPTAPHCTGRRRREEKEKKKNKGPVQGWPPPPAGGGSAGNGNRLETSYLVKKQFTCIHFLLQIHLYLLPKRDNLIFINIEDFIIYTYTIYTTIFIIYPALLQFLVKRI